MSREEINDALKLGGRNPIACSTDVDAPPELKRSKLDGDIGMVECNFSPKDGRIKLTENIEITGYLLIFQDKLALISLQGNSKDATTIEGSLELKFGVSTKIEEIELQNSYGAKFIQRRVSWLTATDEITLKSPARRKDLLELVYIDHQAISILAKAHKAQAAKTLNM